MRPGKIFPPGHYYSPVVDLDVLNADSDRVFDGTLRDLGVDTCVDRQKEMVERFGSDDVLPLQTVARRWKRDNSLFNSTDAAALSAFLQTVRPKRVIEVGSGFSSAIMLDVADARSDIPVELTFIEPYPARLRALLGPNERCTVYEKRVQDVSLDIFDALEAGDLLFLDTTHVVKAGSDVHYDLFSVLPRIKPGVFVHFHDIFWPFEYPRAWFFEKNYSWNETYFLRALLTRPSRFSIVYWNHYLFRFHKEALQASFRGFEVTGAGSIYLQVRDRY